MRCVCLQPRGQFFGVDESEDDDTPKAESVYLSREDRSAAHLIGTRSLPVTKASRRFFCSSLKACTTSQNQVITCSMQVHDTPPTIPCMAYCQIQRCPCRTNTQCA